MNKRLDFLTLTTCVILFIGSTGCSKKETPATQEEMPQTEMNAQNTMNKNAEGKKNIDKKTSAKKDRDIWVVAQNRLKLSNGEIEKLKSLKSDFDKDLKSLRQQKGDTSKQREEVRLKYYSDVKALLGDDRGQRFLSFVRNFKK